MSPGKILVIDSNTDNGALLVRTLARKFPAAAIQLCSDAARALQLAAAEPIAAAVLHRTDEVDAVSLIQEILRVAPQTPIVAVSSVDRSEAVLAAGAAGFLKYDEWLRIGQVVAHVIQPPPTA